MSGFKAAGVLGSILALIALVMVLIKQIIAFVGFLTFAIKVLIFLAFAVVFVGVGYLIFRAWSEKQKRKTNT